MGLKSWMAWEGGVDLVAVTKEGMTMPNVIVHVARMVHTPVGSAPAGMILFAPEEGASPVVMGFVSENAGVGAYFGPHIFAGTPFENAPVLAGKIEIVTAALPEAVAAKVVIGNWTFETRLSAFGAAELINREAGVFPPFAQQGLEQAAGQASLKLNGKAVEIIIPPKGISGGPAAVYSAAGIYAR